MQDIHKYDDIIDLPHHVSKVHGHMSMKDRAAQFSPFAALTGHSDAIDETARLTTKRIELSEDEKTTMDRKLKTVMASTGTDVEFTFTYFVPDIYKEGGIYRTEICSVNKINMTKQIIYLSNGNEIHIPDLIKIDSRMFDIV